MSFLFHERNNLNIVPLNGTNLLKGNGQLIRNQLINLNKLKADAININFFKTMEEREK